MLRDYWLLMVIYIYIKRLDVEEKKKGGGKGERRKIEKETTKGTDKDIKHQTWETI